MDKPKTIKEAIDELQQFLESDLYSKFRPKHEIPIGKEKKIWFREDTFPNEKEFIKYIRDHFNILKKQIKDLI